MAHERAPDSCSKTAMCRSSPLEQFAALVIERVSAVTLAAHNMSRAVAFYRMPGFEIVHGNDAAFISFRAGISLSMSSHNP
jgi:hypothetical protein